jgi:hypothetical protein
MGDDTDPIDPGLTALMLLASFAGMLWLGPAMWEVYILRDTSSLFEAVGSPTAGFVEVLRTLGSGFADPSEYGASAYAYNWLYSAVLLFWVLELLAMPTILRDRVNQCFEEGQ